MLLDIVLYGNPILRKRCAPVTEITEEIRALVRNMIETMDKSNGCGLAAPQVGHALRVFVLRDYIEHEDGNWTLADPKVYINPKITDPTEEMLRDMEGCLSLPKIRLEVERPSQITVEALDLNGNLFKEVVTGYNARIRMHENDHLNGVLFIDRVDAHSRNQIEPQLRAFKKLKR
ncbi:MAG: peptide deformylase [Rhabdochlamydiaceae bacterium]|nr:peptide deformylase [Rhabdochlamydiaceae bacterium]